VSAFPNGHLATTIQNQPGVPGRYGAENSVPCPEFPARNSVRAFSEYALQLHPATGNDSERQ
jgi:hypothetical protein